MWPLWPSRFDLIARDKGASRTLKDVGDAAERTGDSGERLGSRLGTGLKVGAVAAAAGLTAAGAGALKFVQAASLAQDSANAVRVGFGDAAGEVEKLGKAAASTLGLSNTEFNSLAVRFSSFAQTVAGPSGDVADTLDDLTKRAADFASVYGGDVSDAAALFQSALSGETEPIRAFGKDLSAAAVEAFAAANGIGTLGAELTESEKVTARYGLLMQETAEVQGDFANTSDDLANRQRVLSATFGDIQSQLGTALLPLMESLAGVLIDRVVPAVQGFITQFQNSEGPGGRFRDVLAQVGAVLRAVAGFIRDEVVPRIVQFAGFIRTDLIPQVEELQARFQKQVLPRLREVAEYLARTFQPTFQALVDLYRDKLKPGIDQISVALQENRPAIESVGKVAGTLAGVVGFLATQFASKLLPILVQVAGYWLLGFSTAARQVINLVGGIVSNVTRGIEGFRAIAGNVRSFVGALDDIKVPKALRDIADLMDRVGGSVRRATSGVGDRIRDAVGDIAGSFRGTLIGGTGAGGGKALQRVQSILPAGLRITSAYRSPARNAAVGGSPTSKHMDRNNPAVDIGGPTPLLDRFASVLSANGPWRQLLWRVPGHYDHIHVAHNGGVVSSSWPTIPGLKANERPVIAEVGEGITPKRDMGKGGGGISIGTIVAADPRAAVREMRSELALTESLDAMRSVA